MRSTGSCGEEGRAGEAAGLQRGPAWEAGQGPGGGRGMHTQGASQAPSTPISRVRAGLCHMKQGEAAEGVRGRPGPSQK